MNIDRPECPVCHRPVQVEVVDFLSRRVQRQVFGCGAVYDIGTAVWPAACPVVMAEYLAAEREIARLRELLAPAGTTSEPRGGEPAAPAALPVTDEPGQGSGSVSMAAVRGPG